MKRKMRILVAILLLIVTIGTMMTGCGSNPENEKKTDLKKIEKQGILMENYLTISLKGYDGYAKLYADVDLEQLYEDAAQFLIEDVKEVPFTRSKCETVEDYLEDAFRHLDSHELLECETVENLSNGDKVEIYVDLPDGLEYLVAIEASPSVVEYTVKDLEKFEGINPFEFANIFHDGFEVIDGEIGFKLDGGVQMLIQRIDGRPAYIMGTVEVEEGKVYKRTDTVHVSLNPEYIDEYGKDYFTSTETDMTLEKIKYLPVGDYATDVFTHMGVKCMETVVSATQEMMNTYTNTETIVENIGMMFFYDDKDVLESDGNYKYWNQIVFINKITNDDCPDGWYTYMAYNSSVGVGYEVEEATFEETRCVGHIGGFCMEKDYRRYRNEAMDNYKGEYPTTFECNGAEYPGHCDLSEVFVALRSNIPQLSEYDHLIVTESLKDYVQEY